MFQRLINKILKGERASGRIDVTMVNDEEIRELNHRFRKKDRPTDVLSFSYDMGRVLGDVVISGETTRRNARRYGVPYREELKRLIVHGALHVLGYDHGRKMRNAEKIYTQF